MGSCNGKGKQNAKQTEKPDGKKQELNIQTATPQNQLSGQGGVRLGIVFHSYDKSVYILAKTAAESAQKVGIHVELRRITESLSQETLKSRGIHQDISEFEHIKSADPNELVQFDGFLFGGPSTFGSLSAQLKGFIDALGQLWQKGALIGKPVGGFTVAEQFIGGIETEIFLSFIPFLHHGMVIVGNPFEDMSNYKELHGASPHGAGAIYSREQNKILSDISIRSAEFQGNRIAQITQKLAAKK